MSAPVVFLHPLGADARFWDPVRAAALHGGAEYVKRVALPALRLARAA